MAILLQDLRYGGRQLARNWGFTLIAVLALALGIGGTTAIFSVINAVLIRPLAFPESDRLTMVWLDNRSQNIREDATSYPNFAAWRDQNSTFESMAGFTGWHPSLADVEEPEFRIPGSVVGVNFFRVMGVAPIHGRVFAPEEFDARNDDVVILGYGLWQRHFGGDPGIVEKTVTLNDRQLLVVGIMPQGFHFPGKSELWNPMALSERAKAYRESLWLRVVGRLKPGVTVAQAQADMDVIGQRLAQEYPDTNSHHGVYVVSLSEQLTGDIKPTLLILFGAVACVLLIACANVANLLLVRGTARGREMAIRTAMGAGRTRLIRQLLTENLLLTLLGGFAGFLLATLGIKLLKLMATTELPRLEEIGIDVTALVFSLSISLLSGLVFGLAPGRQSFRWQLTEALKEGALSVQGSVRNRRYLMLLVTFEIALALVVLIGAGLLVESFRRLAQVDPGYQPDHLLTMELSLTRSRYPDRSLVLDFFRQFLGRLESSPGVEEVGAASAILTLGTPASGFITLEGRPPLSRTEPEIPYVAVTSNYFRAMRIPILKGESFPEQLSQDNWVVAINQAMEERYWPNENPIGKRFRFQDPNIEQPWMSIIAVVGNVRRFGLESQPRPEVFIAHSQNRNRRMTVVLRTTSDPMGFARMVRAEAAAIDEHQPVFNVRTMEQLLADSVSQRRFVMSLLSLVSVVALVLAMIGIYGVVSHAVSRSIRDIGIRLALGAQKRDVLKLVARDGILMVLTGVFVGVPVALGVAGLMSNMLFGIAPADPGTFVGVSTFLVVVALCACYFPARKAMKVDPIVTLRYE